MCLPKVQISIKRDLRSDLSSPLFVVKVTCTVGLLRESRRCVALMDRILSASEGILVFTLIQWLYLQESSWEDHAGWM